MTRSLNSMSVCKAELFCSRCQTRIFLIHSLKRRFQLLCTKRNQHSPRLRQHPRGIPEEPVPQSSHLAVQILLQNHGYGTHSIPKIWRKAKVIAVEKPGKDPSLAANYTAQSHYTECVLQAPGASCTAAHFSHSRRFTQSRSGWFPERLKHL